jgi:ribokinase
MLHICLLLIGIAKILLLNHHEKMKTLVYGSLNIDLIYSVDKIAIPGETISSFSLTKSAGGKGANQAAALAKAGMETWMAGKIGPDGTFLLSLLESYGVHTEKVIQYEGPSGQAVIQVEKSGQNSIILFAGGNGLVSPDEIEQCLSMFEKGDFVVLQNEIAYTDLIMKKAKDKGMKIALNPSPWNEKAKALPFELADLLFVNEIEGSFLANMGPEVPAANILDSLCTSFPQTEVILTVGKEGVLYGCGKEQARAGIVETPVIDTTGAGDCFSGYFLASRQCGFTIQESLSLACKASSITVSRKGAMESIPFKEEVF